MTTLTLEAIRKNPWNAVTQELPERPTLLLFHTAYLAASYCLRSEQVFMRVARCGIYQPRRWNFGLNTPDVREECEDRICDAERSLELIYDLYDEEFGEILQG